MAKFRFAAVCVGNHDRSPLIAPLLAAACRDAGIDAEIESFGIHESILENPHKGASANSRAVAKEFGGDIEGHIRRHLSQVQLSQYDGFMVVSGEVAQKLFEQDVPASKVYIMCDPNGLDDPYGKEIEYYYECARTIQAEIPRFLEQIRL